MKKFVFVAIALIIVTSVVLLTLKSPKVTNNKLHVVASILPQKEMIERIGGDKINVSIMIPSGFNPETYEPKPGDMKQLSDANVYFRVGIVPFEVLNMATFVELNPTMLVVDTSENLEYRILEEHHHEDSEEHSAEGDAHENEKNMAVETTHENEESDPHVWLSPRNMIIQSEQVLQTLVTLKPEYEAYFTANWESYLEELEELDSNLSKAFAPLQGREILVYHPAFGYLADDYGFIQEYIEIEGKEPTPTQLAGIIDEAKADGVSVIFVQKQFSSNAAEVIAEEIGGSVIQIDPLPENYIESMKQLGKTVQESIL